MTEALETYVVPGGKGWSVINAAGHVLAYDNSEKAAYCRAQAIERAARRVLIRQRPCMCCAQDFPSEGAHNRLCNPCRAAA